MLALFSASDSFKQGIRSTDKPSFTSTPESESATSV